MIIMAAWVVMLMIVMMMMTTSHIRAVTNTMPSDSTRMLVFLAERV